MQATSKKYYPSALFKIETKLVKPCKVKYWSPKQIPHINTLTKYTWLDYDKLNKLSDEHFLKTWQYMALWQSLYYHKLEPKGYNHFRDHHLRLPAINPDNYVKVRNELYRRNLHICNGIDLTDFIKPEKLGEMENEIVEIVGEIGSEIADAIGIKSGKIVLEFGNDEWGLVHIQKHLIEYEKIGFTVIDYIRFVCSNFNQIRRSKNEKYKFDMIDLVYKNGLAKVVHIKLTTTPEGYWSVSTGYPINFKRIDKNTELLWERKK